MSYASFAERHRRCVFSATFFVPGRHRNDEDVGLHEDVGAAP